MMSSAAPEADPALTADETPTISDRLGAAAVASAEHDRPSLTVLTGEHVGALLELGSNELVVGRGGETDLNFADHSLSRRHARFSRRASSHFVQDLESTNGTFVSGKLIDTLVRLDNGDQVQLGSNLILRFNLFNGSEEDAARLVYESSVRDMTSGAYNRRYLDGRLASAEWSDEGPPALLLFDIDAFKSINDIHGHGVGDAVLRIVALSVQRMLRPNDTLARFGGDEFVVLCPSTSRRNGLILAERIRASVARLPFSASGNDFRVSVSVGVAGHDESSDGGIPVAGRGKGSNGGSLVAAADRAMYRAKRSGGNSVALS